MIADISTIVTSSNLTDIVFSSSSTYMCVDICISYIYKSYTYIYPYRFIHIYKYIHANINLQICLEAYHSWILGTIKIS